MNNNQNLKPVFDLEERTTELAKRVIRLCRKLKKDSMNSRLVGQIVGSSGSVGANYREANDSLGKKDFILRLKISRRESKETIHWLELVKEANPEFINEVEGIIRETIEVKNILSAIIKKIENKI